MADPLVTGEPTGTRDEVIQSGNSPALYGSCSMPGPGNKGCTFFVICRFREYRDQQNGKKGPVNVGFAKILKNGVANVNVMSCTTYYRSGAHGDTANSERTGITGDVIAYDGDTVQVRQSVRLHSKMQPGCEGCRLGNCLLREEKEVPYLIPNFRRISDEVASGQATRLRKEMLEKATPGVRRQIEDAEARNNPPVPHTADEQHESGYLQPGVLIGAAKKRT